MRSSPDERARARRVQIMSACQRAVVVAALATIPLAIWLELGPAHPLARVLDWLIWSVFLLEYVVGSALAEQPLRYAARHVLSVVVILVSFPLLPDLLGLVRAVRLVRLGVAFLRGARALRLIFGRRSLGAAVVVTALVVGTGGAMLVILEPETVDGDLGSGLWWAVVTATTVGYGDVVPKSPAGRVVGVVLMLVGIGLVSLLSAAIASYFVQQDEGSELEQVSQRLERIEQLLERLRAGQPLPPDADSTP